MMKFVEMVSITLNARGEPAPVAAQVKQRIDTDNPRTEILKALIYRHANAHLRKASTTIGKIEYLRKRKVD
jgi:hypothetical protein